MVAFELAKFFRNFRAECRRREMVFRGGGEISPLGLEIKAQEAAVRLGGAPGEIPLEAGAPHRMSLL